MASSLVPDPEIREILAGLEVPQEGARLILGVELPENRLIDLLGDLTTIHGFHHIV